MKFIKDKNYIFCVEDVSCEECKKDEKRPNTILRGYGD